MAPVTLPRRWTTARGDVITRLPLHPDRSWVHSEPCQFIKSVVFEQFHPDLGSVRYDMIWQLAPAFAALTPGAEVVGVRWDEGNPSGHGTIFSWGRARYWDRDGARVWEVEVGTGNNHTVLTAEGPSVGPAAPPRAPSAEGAL